MQPQSDDYQIVPLVTFTTRPLTVGELEIALRVAKSDVSAMIDLVVSRSEPQVSREFVCSFTMSTLTKVMADLKASLDTTLYIENLFKEVGES